MRSRSYDKEFKLNALELLKSGKTGATICRDLGIPKSTFWGWFEQREREGSESFTGSGHAKPMNKDVFELQKELEEVRMERDILKKALAIFSKQKL